MTLTQGQGQGHVSKVLIFMTQGQGQGKALKQDTFTSSDNLKNDSQ